MGAVSSADPDKPHPNPSPEGEGLKTFDKPVTPKTVTLAAIAGAHGVTGEVRLKLFGEGVATLKRHKSFNAGALTLNPCATITRAAPSPASPRSPTAPPPSSSAARS